MLQKIISLLIALLAATTMNACNHNASPADDAAGFGAGANPSEPTVVTEQQSTKEEAPERIFFKPILERIDVSFDFTRVSTHASNQFAVWVEDADGKMVKTLAVTGFTASRRGYRSRDMALNAWTFAANPEAMTDAEIDAVSAATPGSGELAYSWDITDSDSIRVEDGVYRIKIEGTLFWESNVLYTAEIDTVDFTAGNLPVSASRSEPDRAENETMLENVRIASVAR